MAHVPLNPIGNDKSSFLDEQETAVNHEFIDGLKQTLEQRRQQVAEGWGEKYQQRVHAKGKLTARERIVLLKDEDSDIFEVGTFVNYGRNFDAGGKEMQSPGAGVVTCFIKVEKRWVIAIANDNTVASGSWWPQTSEKIQRAQQMAMRLGIPVVYLVDCSGLFLPEQSKSFPGATGAGHIFKMNSLLSDKGVPQIAGVFGDCIAGGGYMPIISDRVYMTEQAYMVIAGAALIKGAKSQKLTSLDIGGPEVHVHQSGCADVRVPDDEHCIAAIRNEIANTASSAADYRRGGVSSAPPRFDSSELNELFPSDHRTYYDVKEVIARLVDRSCFWELMPSKGQEMVTGIARINGLYCGIIANVQGPINDSQHPGKLRPGGILYRDGIAKISEFSRACNADGIPLVWLQDISGFDIGTEAEARGLLGYGSSLIYSNSTNNVPMFTILLRKASGAGYYAMAGLPYDPVVQLSTTLARQSVMEGRTLAIAAFNTKLDDEFEIVADSDEEREAIAEGMAATEKRIEGDMCPYKAASQRDTDDIINPDEMRPWLSCLIEASYQSQSSRRVKNPRIWSMHDLSALFGDSE
ncbi:MAG: carboxyl transferase domain-containing protein [Planctomycetota bacterium]|jgi:acetyl-CoA carboxylase carboxyltransferase component|nr:carboxyl transferase domain-containing protein [Planctomycetota bacterium]